MPAKPDQTALLRADVWARAGWRWPFGYEPYTVRRCQGALCDATILWCVSTGSFKRMAPFNRDGVSHFATCPDAKSFRRGRRRREP